MRVENFSKMWGHYEFDKEGHHYRVDTLAGKQDHTGKVWLYVIMKEDQQPAVLKWVEHKLLKSFVHQSS